MHEFLLANAALQRLAQLRAICTLASADSATPPVAPLPAAPATATSLIQRVARHFGLKLGYSHA